MLPIMFAQTKRNLIAGATALAVLAAGTSPALAWGKNEQNFLAGVAATILFQEIIRDAKRHQQPRYQAPVRYDPAPVNIYGSPVGQAFNAYSDNEQRRIQSTLSAYGYYNGTIDGSFGPGTYNALAMYASRTNKTALLGSRAGAFSLLDGLLF
jgi:Putative peptidoglycan binding domain